MGGGRDGVMEEGTREGRYLMYQLRMILYTECSQLIPGGRGCRARERGSGWGERWGYGG